jgi:hypothetical protein
MSKIQVCLLLALFALDSPIVRHLGPYIASKLTAGAGFSLT